MQWVCVEDLENRRAQSLFHPTSKGPPVLQIFCRMSYTYGLQTRPIMPLTLSLCARGDLDTELRQDPSSYPASGFSGKTRLWDGRFFCTIILMSILQLSKHQEISVEVTYMVVAS